MGPSGPRLIARCQTLIREALRPCCGCKIHTGQSLTTNSLVWHDHCKQTKSQSSLRCAMLQISTKSRRASGKYKGATKSLLCFVCPRSRARRCPLFFNSDSPFRVGASCGDRLAGGTPSFSKLALTLILKLFLFTLQPVVSSIGIALAESEIIFKY